ncbi:MAG: hypothetical protein NTY80_00560 [candidate division SR1 bacterium]|nr:hypothetical protein [candidate division SR1 bacterium]
MKKNKNEKSVQQDALDSYANDLIDNKKEAMGYLLVIGFALGIGLFLLVLLNTSNTPIEIVVLFIVVGFIGGMFIFLILLLFRVVYFTCMHKKIQQKLISLLPKEERKEIVTKYATQKIKKLESNSVEYQEIIDSNKIAIQVANDEIELLKNEL